jgi:ribosome-binding factor A
VSKEDDEFRSGAGNASRYKAGRICRQALEALSLALQECGDGALSEAVVVSVEPAPDASRLSVMVEVPAGHDPKRFWEALGRAHGRLRTEVAAALQRKRAPELVFRLQDPSSSR